MIHDALKHALTTTTNAHIPCERAALLLASSMFMSVVAARAVCTASADLGPDDVRADPGVGGLAKPGADGHADPGSDGLAESGADSRAYPGADGRARKVGQVFFADKTSFIAT